MGNKNALQVFEFENSRSIRVIDINGEPWFVAKDICEILELSDVSMSVSRLEDDERGTSKVCTPAGDCS